MRRGEIWRYKPQGPRGERLLVIVSGAGINDDDRRQWVLGIEVIDRDPSDLLAVPVPEGWADASTVVRAYRRWLTDRVDVLDRSTIERLDVALRAALDL